MGTPRSSLKATPGSLPYPTGAEIEIPDLAGASTTLVSATHGEKTVRLNSTEPNGCVVLWAANSANAKTFIGMIVDHGSEDIKVYNGATVNTAQVLICILKPGSAGTLSTRSVATAKGLWKWSGTDTLGRYLTQRIGAVNAALDIGTNGFQLTGGSGQSRCADFYGATPFNQFAGMWAEKTTDDIEAVSVLFDTSHACTPGSLTAIATGANVMLCQGLNGRTDADAIMIRHREQTAAVFHGNGATMASDVFTLGTPIDVDAGISATHALGAEDCVEDFAYGGQFVTSMRVATGTALVTFKLTGNSLVAGDSLVVCASATLMNRISSYAAGKVMYVGEESGGRSTINHATIADYTAAPVEDWESETLGHDLDAGDGFYLLSNGTTKTALARLGSVWGVATFTASALIGFKNITGANQAFETTMGPVIDMGQQVTSCGDDMALGWVQDDDAVSTIQVGLFRPSQMYSRWYETDKGENGIIPVFGVGGVNFATELWLNGANESILQCRVVHPITRNLLISWNRKDESGANFYARYGIWEIPELI